MAGPGKSLLFGLIGNPVSHSLSPFIMNRAFEAAGMDAFYVAFGIDAEHLVPSVAGLASLGVSGLNVTYPYKEEVLYHLPAISTECEIIQAVNTISVYEDEMHGFNTDAPGTAIALETFTSVPLEGARAFIYGSGGSARAAAYGLLERGAERVTFATRSSDRGPMIAERFAFAFPEQTVDFVRMGVAEDAARRVEAFRGAHVVINATPVGMDGQPNVELIENAAWIGEQQTFFDFVYHPRRTLFLDTARDAGAATLGGIALLVAQASESFRIWTEQGFDIKSMVEAVEVFSASETAGGGRVH